MVFQLAQHAMLFSLKDEYIFSITIPAKVQSYLACGKPLLAMINGEAEKIITEGQTGFACASGDYDGLAKNIIKMNNLSNKELKKLSNNSLQYNRNFFDREMLFKRAEDIFYQTINSYKN